MLTVQNYEFLNNKLNEQVYIRVVNEHLTHLDDVPYDVERLIQTVKEINGQVDNMFEDQQEQTLRHAVSSCLTIHELYHELATDSRPQLLRFKTLLDEIMASQTLYRKFIYAIQA